MCLCALCLAPFGLAPCALQFACLCLAPDTLQLLQTPQLLAQSSGCAQLFLPCNTVAYVGVHAWHMTLHEPLRNHCTCECACLALTLPVLTHIPMRLPPHLPMRARVRVQMPMLLPAGVHLSMP